MLQRLRDAVLHGDREQALELTEQALAQGVLAGEIVDTSLTPAMDQVGDEYDHGDRFIPEMLMSGEVAKAVLDGLRPMLIDGSREAGGTVAIGTVEGDLHDIGKSLVAMMLQGAGFSVVDLGVEVPTERFVEFVTEQKPDILALSALLTTTMVHMADVIDGLKEAGLRDQVGVIVGGAPVTGEFADRIGADGYAPDAPSAVRLVRKLMQAASRDHVGS